MNKIVSYKLKKVVLWSSLFLFLFSCSGNRDKKICQVGEHILYASELEVRKELFFPHLNDEEAKKKAIEQWIEQQGVKLEIESVSPKVKVAHELSIEDELMQLNLFELENQFITKHLDSIISEQEIQDYYESHRENYKAESYIVRALYIKVPDTVAGVLNIDEHYLLKNDKDLEEIKKYANLYASGFYFE